jgi:hypothetical protein
MSVSQELSTLAAVAAKAIIKQSNEQRAAVKPNPLPPVYALTEAQANQVTEQVFNEFGWANHRDSIIKEIADSISGEVR